MSKQHALVIEPVWCCQRQSACRWPGIVLVNGLAWGSVPAAESAWRRSHDSICGGTLIQVSSYQYFCCDTVFTADDFSFHVQQCHSPSLDTPSQGHN